MAPSDSAREEQTDAIDLLAELAAWHRRRVTDTKLYDATVGTSGVDWRHTQQPRPVASDWFRRQFRMTTAGRTLTLRANDRFIAADVRGEFAVTPFSINRPNRVLGQVHESSVVIGSTAMALFSAAAADASAILTTPGVGRAIESLRLATDESVHVYGNGVTVYFMPTSRQRILDGVAAATALAEQLPADEATAVDVSDLPEALLPLAPLATRWGLSDDADRGDYLSRTSTRELQRLVRAVTPLFGAVNEYLDAFRGAPMPASATRLGALAECAAEAQRMLERRAAEAPTERLRPPAARRAAKKRTGPRGSR